MPYFVTRQSYWHEEGECAVELVRAPSFDYVGPDELADRPGIPSGGEHDDPREAAREAVDIVRAWPEAKGRIVIANGVALQIVYPVLDDDEQCFSAVQALMWADEEFERLPKCERCGDIAPAEDNFMDRFGDKFTACGESCADAIAWDRENYDPEGDDDECE